MAAMAENGKGGDDVIAKAGDRFHALQGAGTEHVPARIQGDGLQPVPQGMGFVQLPRATSGIFQVKCPAEGGPHILRQHGIEKPLQGRARTAHSKAQSRRDHPDAAVTPQGAEAIPQRQPHRAGHDHERISQHQAERGEASGGEAASSKSRDYDYGYDQD